MLKIYTINYVLEKSRLILLNKAIINFYILQLFHFSSPYTCVFMSFGNHNKQVPRHLMCQIAGKGIKNEGNLDRNRDKHISRTT